MREGLFSLKTRPGRKGCCVLGVNENSGRTTSSTALNFGNLSIPKDEGKMLGNGGKKQIKVRTISFRGRDLLKEEVKISINALNLKRGVSGIPRAPKRRRLNLLKHGET